MAGSEHLQLHTGACAIPDGDGKHRGVVLGNLSVAGEWKWKVDGVDRLLLEDRSLNQRRRWLSSGIDQGLK